MGSSPACGAVADGHICAFGALAVNQAIHILHIIIVTIHTYLCSTGAEAYGLAARGQSQLIHSGVQSAVRVRCRRYRQDDFRVLRSNLLHQGLIHFDRTHIGFKHKLGCSRVCQSICGVGRNHNLGGSDAGLAGSCIHDHGGAVNGDTVCCGRNKNAAGHGSRCCFAAGGHAVYLNRGSCSAVTGNSDLHSLGQSIGSVGRGAGNGSFATCDSGDLAVRYNSNRFIAGFPGNYVAVTILERCGYSCGVVTLHAGNQRYLIYIHLQGSLCVHNLQGVVVDFQQNILFTNAKHFHHVNAHAAVDLVVVVVCAHVRQGNTDLRSTDVIIRSGHLGRCATNCSSRTCCADFVIAYILHFCQIIAVCRIIQHIGASSVRGVFAVDPILQQRTIASGNFHGIEVHIQLANTVLNDQSCLMTDGTVCHGGSVIGCSAHLDLDRVSAVCQIGSVQTDAVLGYQTINRNLQCILCGIDLDLCRFFICQYCFRSADCRSQGRISLRSILIFLIGLCGCNQFSKLCGVHRGGNQVVNCGSQSTVCCCHLSNRSGIVIIHSLGCLVCFIHGGVGSICIVCSINNFCNCDFLTKSFPNRCIRSLIRNFHCTTIINSESRILGKVAATNQIHNRNTETHGKLSIIRRQFEIYSFRVKCKCTFIKLIS